MKPWHECTGDELAEHIRTWAVAPGEQSLRAYFGMTWAEYAAFRDQGVEAAKVVRLEAIAKRMGFDTSAGSGEGEAGESP